MRLKLKELRRLLHESLEERLFLRDTRDPDADLKRGFSGYAGAWFDTEDEALDYQRHVATLGPPRQDPVTRKWCGDSELGLSAFEFHDLESFQRAMQLLESEGAYEQIAVFASSDYDLRAGADGEDVFRPGRFLIRINASTSYEELMTSLGR